MAASVMTATPNTANPNSTTSGTRPAQPAFIESAATEVNDTTMLTDPRY